LIRLGDEEETETAGAKLAIVEHAANPRIKDWI